MFEGKSVAAVIAAAGSGTRMGGLIPKQYLEIDGTPILVHSIRALQSASVLDTVVVAVSPGSEEDVSAMLAGAGMGYVRIVTGGSHRQHSVTAGIRALASNPPDLVLIHDAVRPCVTQMLVLDVLRAALEFGASTTGVVPKDTMKQVDAEGFVQSTPERALVRSIQTPQAFTFALIQEAQTRAGEEGYLGTDEAVLVERIGGRVRVVEGSYQNIKVTTPEDLAIATEWLKNRVIREGS